MSSVVEPMVLADLHPCTIGETSYVLRTPDVYDPARLRRFMGRQGVRQRPAVIELMVCARAGLMALAATVGAPEEGERQAALYEEYFGLLDPVNEDDIDEPDQDRRATIVAEQEAQRAARRVEIYPQVMAIEASLERHWQDYYQLKADRSFWDEVSEIDVVRLLLVSIDGAAVRQDDDRLLTQKAYKAIPPEHRSPLARFAFRLFAPTETQKKT
jgi:hypothetical protein